MFSVLKLFYLCFITIFSTYILYNNDISNANNVLYIGLVHVNGNNNYNGSNCHNSKITKKNTPMAIIT